MPSLKHYSSSEVNQYELSSRLLSLTENNTSYTLTQINGQRIYRKAPNAWNGPEPSRNCEYITTNQLYQVSGSSISSQVSCSSLDILDVRFSDPLVYYFACRLQLSHARRVYLSFLKAVFIGRIPHDCFEDTLVPLFRQAGELFEFRLMINFSGWNRGYAFAMYTTETEATNAIHLFNNYMIRPSWQLGVCPSINNCRIFISRIPPTTPSAEIVRLLYALTDEVHEVRIRRSIASCAAIVEYKSHRGAAMARKALVAAAAAAWGGGARPAVDWSLPQSPQLLRQYREVGRWSPERGVELVRVGGECETGAGTGASLALERWSAARRLRMIHEAQRNAAAAQAQARHKWSEHIGMETLMASMTALNMSGAGPGYERGVWGPPEGAAGPGAGAARDFNPWTARHPLEEFVAPREQ